MSPWLGLLSATAEPGDHPHPPVSRSFGGQESSAGRVAGRYVIVQRGAAKEFSSLKLTNG
jgi:hypothetical protein